jgi:hypothetical protein
MERKFGKASVDQTALCLRITVAGSGTLKVDTASGKEVYG